MPSTAQGRERNSWAAQAANTDRARSLLPADPDEAWRAYRRQRAEAVRLRRRIKQEGGADDLLAQQLATQRARVLAMRNELVERHLGTLAYVAERLKLTLPSFVEVDELMLSGTPALIRLVERFRPELGFQFETFATRRLHGAMVDALRKMDEVPRLARQRNGVRDEAIQRFVKEHGRLPSDEETRAALRVKDEKERQKVMEEKPIPNSTSIDAPVRSSRASDPQTVGELIPGRSRNPLTAAQREDLKRFITRHLPRRDRLILLLYYFEHLTMKEVATALGISESRVSQCLTNLHEQLRARMQQKQEELEV